MPFISQDKLQKLERAARNDADIKKVEKRFDRELKKARESYSERLEDIEDANQREVKTLERKLTKVEVAVKDAVAEANEAHTASIKQIKASLNDEINELSDSNITLQDQIRVYEERTSTESDLLKRELDLADEEDENLRVAKFLKDREDEFEKKVKAFDERVLDENETQYKRGFTDGVSDTLREGNEKAETANERVFKLADKAISKDTTVITTSQAPVKQSK